MKIILFLMVSLLKFGGEALYAVEASSSRPQKETKDQKVTLKLLEPISPQKHAEEEETITSNLGELLEDPKNEALKAVKVLGKKKRLEGPARAIKITWEEVALDVQPSAEQAAKGVQVAAVNSLKEPVKKPLQSAFVQKTPDAVESGTPIEAKGDVDGLLAAARSLLIRAQKQGFQVTPHAIPPGLGLGSSAAREKAAQGNPGKAASLSKRTGDRASSSGRRGTEDARSEVQSEGNAQRRDPEATSNGRSSSSQPQGDRSSPYHSTPRETHSYPSYSPFSGSSNSNPYSFTSYRGSGFDSSYQGGSPWPKKGKKKKGQDEREGRDDEGAYSSSRPSLRTENPYASSGGTERRDEREETGDEVESSSTKHKRRHKKGRRSEAGGSSSFSSEDERHPTRDYTDGYRSDEGGSVRRGESRRTEGDMAAAETLSEEDSEGETDAPHARRTTRPGEMGHRNRRTRRDGPLGAGFEGRDGEFDYPFGVGREGGVEGETHIPVITVEYDYASCSPRIDWASKQAILQARAITLTDGVRSNESDCADTLKKFPIKKDYTHPDCADVIERSHEDGVDRTNFGFAYASYKPYWVNEASERQYLGNVQKDENHPFAIKEEEGSCSYKVDLEALEAKPQSELVYENRSKNRVVVEPCRPSVRGTSVRITATKKGCGYVHQFDANRSMPQKRLVYSVKGVEHEALPCHDASDTWINHQFDTGVCKPIVYEDTLTQQPFARRFIETEEGKLWLSECEPYGTTGALLTDAAACSAAPYHHDFLGKQSYLNVRYYYNRLHGKKYVTGCQPGMDVFAHRKTVVGYVHDDARKNSKLKVEVSFDHTGRKVVVVPSQVDETETPAPYVKLREAIETAPYQTKMNDRCYQEQRFKKHNVYQRADRTEYLDRIDDKVHTVDRCVRTKEKMEEPCFVTWMIYREESCGDNIVNNLSWGNVVFRNYGNCPIDGRTLWEHFPSNGRLWKTDRLMERLKTVYPDSPHPDYTPWEWTGYYRDHSITGCHRGADGAHPPIEGKTWHHTERKFSPIPG